MITTSPVTRTKTGQCLCGAVKLTAEDVEDGYHACHCGMCRRWSGGSPYFSVNARAVRFEDPSAVGRFASSSWAERGFCKRCGTTLFYLLKSAGIYAVSIGVLDGGESLRLAEEIYVDHKPESYALTGDHPRLTEAETLAKYT